MNGEKIRRFSGYRIIEHWMYVIVILLLVLTGLPQRFHYLELSQWFVLELGGIDNTRIIHRYTGAVFVLLSLFHIVIMITGLVFKKLQPSMVITKKDFTDVIHNIQYYIGLKDRPALCDRYNYKQKFEYWGIFLGGVVMIISGLILWFPAAITRHLPGEVIPVAKALHANEALLIFLIIAVWHIYNAIFSPEVFPLDTSIFTGYISKERMLREHPLELERIEGIDGEDIRP